MPLFSRVVKNHAVLDLKSERITSSDQTKMIGDTKLMHIYSESHMDDSYDD